MHDSLLTSSLFVTGKQFAHFVLDITSVFLGKLDIPFSDSISGKLDTDDWADSVKFPGLLQSSHSNFNRIYYWASVNTSRIDCEFSAL